MLSEKTRGNLSIEEQRLIENSVTELRFRYVQVTERAAKEKVAAAETPSDNAARRDRRRPRFTSPCWDRAPARAFRPLAARCEVCPSTDPRDNRLRPSILIRYGGRTVVVDTTPDFRAQVLRAGLERLDAILYTHAHADHILGLDDVRPFNYRQKAPIPIFAMQDTLDAIRRVFRYAFDDEPQQSAVPKLDLRPLDGSPFEVIGLEFTPIRSVPRQRNGATDSGSARAAYLTDLSEIPEESQSKLARPGCAVPGCAAAPSSSHAFHRGAGARAGWRSCKPQRAFFTHMCHDLSHERTEAALPPHVRLAYDGLEIDVETS